MVLGALLRWMKACLENANTIGTVNLYNEFVCPIYWWTRTVCFVTWMFPFDASVIGLCNEFYLKRSYPGQKTDVGPWRNLSGNVSCHFIIMWMYITMIFHVNYNRQNYFVQWNPWVNNCEFKMNITFLNVLIKMIQFLY